MSESKISGVIARYIWRDERSGMSMLTLETSHKLPSACVSKWEEKEGKQISSVVCLTSIPYLGEGTPVQFSGYFMMKKPGYNSMTFNVTKFTELTSGRDTVRDYLLSMKVSRQDAEAIADLVGEGDLFKFCQEQDAAAKIRSVTEMPNDKLGLLLDKIRKEKVEGEIYQKLHAYSISYNACLKFCKHHGQNSMRALYEDPYELVRFGAPFVQVDNLAKSLDIQKDGIKRLNAIGTAVMDRLENNGNTFTNPGKFRSIAQHIDTRVLDMEVIPSMETVQIVKMKGEYRIEKKDLYNAERRIKKNIRRIKSETTNYVVGKDLIEYAEEQCHMHYGSQQKQAFGTVLGSNGIKVLTGGPGTGKTTTVKGILLAFQKIHPGCQIKLCAPTGRAAQRMSESTGFPATTIHRLLEYRPFDTGEAAHKDASDPIQADLIVCDEMSMADTRLFDMLIDAVPTGATLLLVGDENQLEPVGPGTILHDVMKEASVTKLTEVFRQKGGSPIVENSVRVQQNQTDLMLCDDFQILYAESEEDLRKTALRMVKSYYLPNDPFQTQILCPSKKGIAGVDALNEQAQQMLNPRKKGEAEVHYGKTAFRVHDKIIMIRNNPAMDYYNGDIGVVTDITDGLLTVNIRDNLIQLSRDLMADIKLAYCMTIHKSQGSEFKNVVIVMPKNPAGMLVRNLFYTAITRAKKKVIVISEQNAVQTSIMRKHMPRHSMLEDMLLEIPYQEIQKGDRLQ